ncbi:tRNA guanosine(34) transglycosylase Tgt [Roseomonas elaeocarpi]|uniref:Queuine tRNA-ribosyltransferase n=1 Tax=Roseomonas elaeocarpi TaxID=907779 RepID=A0ABV6JT45_9PROT
MTLHHTLQATDGRARAGTLHTAHGEVPTPVFMPVGTAGTVKAMTADAVRATGARMILGNTYHLMLRPGAERVGRLGGLHRMVDWDGPILTDSGGFQVMSLAKLRKMDRDGVTFRSHVDGSKHRLTPERSIEIQHLLDADVTMCLDECIPFPATEEEAARAMRMSMLWAARCREAFVPREGYGLFGIVQGGVFPELRAESVRALTEIGFEGYAVGGLAVGEGQEIMFQTLDITTPLLPADKAHYLMGVGTPSDLIGGVRRGIDMFDCVMPTRSGRTARAYTSRGVMNMRNARFADDATTLDPECNCPACTRHTRAYLHHLFRAEEMLGPMLLTWHNIRYYQRLMERLRAAILAGRFEDEAARIEAGWEAGAAEAAALKTVVPGAAAALAGGATPLPGNAAAPLAAGDADPTSGVVAADTVPFPVPAGNEAPESNA